MIYKVEDIYNTIALKTGFPLYTNDTDTPDTTRFLLDVISDGLTATINSIYLTNNVLERQDEILTNAENTLYGVKGIIKAVNIQNKAGSGSTGYSRLPYNNEVNIFDGESETEADKKGYPTSYVIKGGYLKFYPNPDKEYKVKLTLSTTDLVLSDNDTSKSIIDNINDSIIADEDFIRIIIVKSVALLFTRLQNANATYYANLADSMTGLYIENDYGTFEQNRIFKRRMGNYNPDVGFLG